MIKLSSSGDWSKTTKFLNHLHVIDYKSILAKYGEQGVRALQNATPVDSGLTASSWSFSIHDTGSSASIDFTNSNIQNGVLIAVIIQYGHGTRNGGYVQGVDYINPALKPVFDAIAESVWKEVTRDK